MLTPSKTNEKKSVLLTTDEPNDHEIYFLPSPKLAEGTKTIQDDAWKHAIRQVRSTLSFQPEVYMHDGRVGSSKNASVGVRLIFNTPASALQLHFAFPPVPKCEAKKFHHDVTGWMVETDNLNFQKEHFAIKSNNYTLVDLATRRFITVGKLTQNVIRNSLFAVLGDCFSGAEQKTPVDRKAPQDKQTGSILLNCDSVVDGNDTGLVFSLGGSSASQKGNLELYSANNTIWSSNGLSRAWDSYSLDHVPTTAQRGDIIETIGNKTRFTSKLENPLGNVADHPKFALFFEEGKNSVSNLEPAEVKNLLLEKTLSPAVDKDAFGAKVEQLLADNKTKCYKVSAAVADLPELVSKAFAGKEPVVSASAASTEKPKEEAQKPKKPRRGRPKKN